MIIHIVLTLILFLGIFGGGKLYKFIKKGGVSDKIYNTLIVIIWGAIWFFLPISSQPRMEGIFVLPLQIMGMILLPVFFIIGHFALEKRKTWGYQQSELCIRGIYAVIRHPIYIAWFIFYIAWSLIWRAVYSLYSIPVMFLLIYLEAYLEEKYMVGKEFPEKYKNYQKEVGMFFPRFSAICRICPLCIIARKYPDSGFARMIKSWSSICPFCRAYAKENERR